ncbi:MAG: non-heme iron oxygenase ferredoxin subunit [Euryarchaeota archaeon RBG_16_68_12]|nr:MAG: non-heme iron oxygenase ferredoxin subunit [Euryarchaeota archaeon RBG_16_68_12]
MADFIEVARTSDVPPGHSTIVVAAGHVIALYNVGGTFHATSNVCLHRGGPVGEGDLEGSVVTCPWHGWRYDVKTGQNLANPVARLKTYEVKVEGDRILVAPA